MTTPFRFAIFLHIFSRDKSSSWHRPNGSSQRKILGPILSLSLELYHFNDYRLSISQLIRSGHWRPNIAYWDEYFPERYVNR